MEFSIAQWVFGLVAGTACLFALGYAVERASRRRHNRRSRTAEHHQLNDGRTLHFALTGRTDGPLVVLEAGGGASMASWAALPAQLSPHAGVLSYDRAGYGFSDSVTTNRTFDHMADDLQELLSTIAPARPLVLVGASLGGLLVRHFNRRYPARVVGMLLLDAAEEVHTYARLRHLHRMRKGARLMARLARVGIPRGLLTLLPALAGLPPGISRCARTAILRDAVDPRAFLAGAQEMAAYFAVPTEMRAAAGFGHLGALPLTVITHGRPLTGGQAFLEPGWSEAQQRLTGLSSQSRLVTAHDSGHLIGLEQPELVVTEVRRLVALADQRP